MAAEIVAVLNVFKPVKKFVFGSVKDYVGYIGSCDKNLGLLHATLDDLCNKKELIEEDVMRGTRRQGKITREAASWLQQVRVLADDKVLKGLIYKDIHTAKLVLKMMAKKDLKWRLSKDSEMQVVVVKVMKELKDEMVMSEGEMRIFKEADYTKVTEVVVEMMKDSIDEFKQLLKEDRMMAVIAIRTLKGTDLDKLMEGDMEMEHIFMKVLNGSDEELLPNHEDMESNAPLLKTPPVDSNKTNKFKEAAKVFTPLANLFTPLRDLMDDASFKKAVPEADIIKLGLEVIDGLFIKGHGMNKQMDGDAKQHRYCGCSLLSPCDYHGRYQISKAAKFMSKHIHDEIIEKRPQNSVTVPIPIGDLKPVPTQFLESLESRKKLVEQILKKLNDDQVDVVGVFGIGGAGKTTIAKEVNRRLKDFKIKVMVEVSDAPDIARIQTTIAESIKLPLHDVDDVRLRAMKLYNMLSKKEEKILIVLDNVWKELNLGDIGIPSTCKLLLTTRERKVCRVMNVQNVNILEVGFMNIIESKTLFTKQIGVQVDAGKYKNVVERLLNKCGGLPLTIVATANSLKDKDFSSWEKFADDSEKPTSSQISGEYRHIYAILSTSYKFIQVEEKRIFFLLACLTPRGSGASIENLMRYGIGLNLFQHVNKLSEAMEQADTWAKELVLSSMLVEGDVKGEVKIHDIVRDFAISLASKEEGHKFMVEEIPRWMGDETLRKYTAMSLTSMEKCSCFAGVEASKLQILILKGDLSSNFNHSFYEGMTNLEVLVLSKVTFQPSLPESMRKLEKLKTLCMEGCKLGEIKLVGELVNLLVLSLRKSFFEELPDEIGELSKLRLLDLSECTCIKEPLIQSTVLARLNELEGLYSFINHEGVSVFEKKTDEEMGVTKNRLPYLNIFEVRLPGTEDIVIDGQSLRNLDKFRVSIGKTVCRWPVYLFSRMLHIDDSYGLSRCFENNFLKAFLKKADWLDISTDSHFIVPSNIESIVPSNIESIVPGLDQVGFRDLKCLLISQNNSIRSLVNGHMINNLTVFPSLLLLKLHWLEHLERIYDGEVPEGMFCNLENLMLAFLDKLEYGLPLIPCNLKEIDVSFCKLLNFLFTEDEETKVIELPFLKSMNLYNLPRLLSLVGRKDEETKVIHAFSEYFFDAKITYPSLEVFKLYGCDSIAKLWNNEIPTSSFSNLKEVEIKRCHKLLNVGPPFAVSSFVQLESLEIDNCDKMSEIITSEDTGEQKVIRFHELKFLTITYLSELESFYQGKSKLEFPKLEKLTLRGNQNMKSFAKLENSLALFPENIDFPCLHTLKVIDMPEVNALWDSQAHRGSVMSNPAPLLRHLTLGTSGLRHIPSVLLANLSSLRLVAYQTGDVVFSSSDVDTNEGFVWRCSHLPRLEGLHVKNNESLKELFKAEDYDGVGGTFCGQLKTLVLNSLPTLKLIPLNLFKGLESLTLYDLGWEYVVSAAVLGDSLQQLQFLDIRDCKNMRAVVIDVGTSLELPRLKELLLTRLGSIKSFSSTTNGEATLLLPSLESLRIWGCDALEHFWSGSIVAPSLQSVNVVNCNKMQHLLVGNTEQVLEFPSLQQVYISICSNIKSISSGPLNAPKLREVDLYRCYSMECFLPENPNHCGVLKLLSLEVVTIKDCPNLRSFSFTPPVAPKLTHVTYNEKDYSMLAYNNLNHFLKEQREEEEEEEEENRRMGLVTDEKETGEEEEEEETDEKDTEEEETDEEETEEETEKEEETEEGEEETEEKEEEMEEGEEETGKQEEVVEEDI